MCEAAGFGQPQYEIKVSHTGPDGYLYFTYKVWIPGINMAFEGVDVILPRPTNITTIEEAKQAAAHQILQKVNHTQFSEWQACQIERSSQPLLNCSRLCLICY